MTSNQQLTILRRLDEIERSVKAIRAAIEGAVTTEPARFGLRGPSGERIKIARRERGLTQGELAAKIGMLAAQLCRIETGKTDPSTRVLCRIAEGLGIAPEALLGDTK